jgi:RNA polymerase sigma-70 factor (ECF subfamily)
MGEPPREDPAAVVGRLYDLYGVSLYRYAVILLADAAAAEDAIQQVFASLLRVATWASLENEAHYLRRAVRNECYSMLRRGRVWRVDEAHAILELQPSVDLRPDDRLALERALRELPPEQREVVHLHVFEGLTFQEVADAAGESINTISSRYRYALAKLRQVLG